MDPEIAVTAARHGIRPHRLHLLCNHADISLVATEIAEAVVAETVVEMAQQDDVVLHCEIGTPATATSASTATTSSEATTTSTSVATTASAATEAAAAPTAGTGKARPASCGRSTCRSARRDIEATSSSRPVRCSGTIGSAARAGGTTVAGIGGLAIGRAGTIGAAAIAGTIASAVPCTI